MSDLERRLRDRLFVDTTGCWVWMGGTNGRYGQMSVKGRMKYVHRLAYELWVGPIPEGLTIDHLCANKLCINPEHLEPVSSKANTQRAAEALTHCINGHPYTPENTYVQVFKPGDKLGRTTGRQCRRCNTEKHRLRQLIPTTEGADA